MSLTKVSSAMQSDAGWEFIGTVTASASATIAFTNMVAGYDYQYVFENIVGATDTNEFMCQIGVTTPTYRTSGYKTTTSQINNAGTSISTTDTTQISLVPTGGQEMGNSTDEALHRVEITFSDPAGTDNKTSWLAFSTLFGHDAQMQFLNTVGFYQTTAEANTAVKFYMETGNITSGEIHQYKRKLS